MNYQDEAARTQLLVAADRAEASGDGPRASVLRTQAGAVGTVADTFRDLPCICGERHPPGYFGERLGMPGVPAHPGTHYPIRQPMDVRKGAAALVSAAHGDGRAELVLALEILRRLARALRSIAPRTVRKVRSAAKSAEGAIRHKECRAVRATLGRPDRECDWDCTRRRIPAAECDCSRSRA